MLILHLKLSVLNNHSLRHIIKDLKPRKHPQKVEKLKVHTNLEKFHMNLILNKIYHRPKHKAITYPLVKFSYLNSLKENKRYRTAIFSNTFSQEPLKS